MAWQAAWAGAEAKAKLLRWAVAIVTGEAEANERQTDLAYKLVEAQAERWAGEPVKPSVEGAKKHRKADPPSPAASLKTRDDIYAKIAVATGATPAPTG